MSIKKIFTNNYEKVIFIVIILIDLSIMIRYSDVQSLWHDELYQVSVCAEASSVLDVLHMYLTTDAAPPFFALIAYIWYNITPYGERWIMFLPEVLTCMSIYFVGLSANQLRGKNYGIFCVIVSALIPALTIFVGYEFRHYAVTLLVSSMLIYFYTLRCRNNKKTPIWILCSYGISLALIVYSFYLCVLICFVLFIFDIYLCAKKAAEIRCLSSYFIGGALFLPWAIARYLSMRDIGINVIPEDFWPQTPTFSSIMEILNFFTYGNIGLSILLSCGLAAGITVLIKNRNLDIIKKRDVFFLKICTVMVLFYIGAIFIHSRFIMVEGSLWVDRYFLCLIPYCVLLMGYVVDKLLCTVSVLTNKSKISGSLVMVVSLSLVIFILPSTVDDIESYQNDIREPFRQVSKYLKKQDDINSKDTIVVVTVSDRIVNGWQDFYFDKKDSNEKIKGIKIVSETSDEIDNLETYNSIYFFNVHKFGSDEQKVQNDFEISLNKRYNKVDDIEKYGLTKYGHSD